MDRSVLFVSKNRQLILRLKSSLHNLKNIEYSQNYNIDLTNNNHEIIIYPSYPYLKDHLKSVSKFSELIIYGKQNLLKFCYQKGCSDYLKIPWDHEEMVLRLSKMKAGSLYYKKDHNIFLDNNHVLNINNLHISLSYQEYLIMKILFKFPDTPISREILYQAINYYKNDQSRVVEVHISNIRKKINQPDFLIRNIRNRGYMISHS